MPMLPFGGLSKAKEPTQRKQARDLLHRGAGLSRLPRYL